ncbi:MAG: hypothetical protein R6X35_07750 [Candidatus Krumholzibacteriia bacterium]
MNCLMGVLAGVVLFAGTQYGAGEIAQEYRRLHADSEGRMLLNRAQAGRDLIEDEIVHFGVERDGPFAYSVMFHANGECEYQGASGLRVVYVRGDSCSAGMRAYAGRVSPRAFKEVAQSVAEHGFFELDDAYVGDLNDVASTYTLVETAETKKIVRHIEGYGPAELATIARLIRGLIFEVSWDD